MLDATASGFYRQIVSKSQFPWAIVVILALATIVFHLLGLVIAAIGLFIAYFASLWLHPRTRHGRCKGTGEVRGSVFTWTHRKCPGCQSGRVVRWGAGHMGADHIQGEYKRTKTTRQLAKENHRWR
jgi:hypothetical protein